MMKRLLAALILVGLLATPAYAKGNPHHLALALADPTVTATPNPASANSTVWVSGCGYPVGAETLDALAIGPVAIVVTHPAGTDVWASGMGGDGCFGAVIPTTEAGDYTLTVYQLTYTDTGYALGTLYASTTLSVT